MKTLAIMSIVLAAGSSGASAFEFRCRFVERVGNTDIVLPGNEIDASNNIARRIRIQFGVFDDAAGPAPAGGYVGWLAGTLSVSGPANNSDETRTPGRLSPFNFGPGVNANGNPPLPGGDPFTMLTEIDNTLGTQTTVWPVGAPEPNPPVVRGLNTYVSTYEFTINPRDFSREYYAVTLAGNVVAATEWRGGNGVPPSDSDGDGIFDTPGSFTWSPFPTTLRPITATLNVLGGVPAPAAGPLLGGLVLFAARRRRQ